MRRSVTLLPWQTRQDLFRRTGQHILTVEDYNAFISGGGGGFCTDQTGDFDAMREGYYGA